MKMDTLFYNAYLFNTPYKKFLYGYFGVRDGNIVLTGRGEPPETTEAVRRIDLGGR